jgi:hypothetical protein
MGIREAEPYVGHRVLVRHTDRHGDVHETKGMLDALEHIPMYGAAIYVDGAELSLDRVLTILDLGEQAA